MSSTIPLFNFGEYSMEYNMNNIFPLIVVGTTQENIFSTLSNGCTHERLRRGIKIVIRYTLF